MTLLLVQQPPAAGGSTKRDRRPVPSFCGNGGGSARQVLVMFCKTSARRQFAAVPIQFRCNSKAILIPLQKFSSESPVENLTPCDGPHDSLWSRSDLGFDHFREYNGPCSQRAPQIPQIRAYHSTWTSCNSPKSGRGAVRLVGPLYGTLDPVTPESNVANCCIQRLEHLHICIQYLQHLQPPSATSPTSPCHTSQVSNISMQDDKHLQPTFSLPPNTLNVSNQHLQNPIHRPSICTQRS